MNYEVKKVNGALVEVVLKVSGEEVSKERKSILDKISKEAEVPGFRKGHAPISAIEGKFENEIKGELTEKLISLHYPKIIETEDLKPVDYVKIKDAKVEGDSFEATLLVEVYPEFELGEYKGLEVEKENFEMNDEILDKEIEAMLLRGAKLEEAGEGHKAELGDTVDLAFEGFVDGTPFEGGKSDNHTLKLGSKMFIDTFEEQLVGYTKGQEGEVNVTFPTEYHSADLAGKEATFKVKINAIKVESKPELNDEFAKENNFESVEDLKAKKKEEIVAREEARVLNEYRGKLLEKVTTGTEVVVPQAMVEREVAMRISQMENQLGQQGMNMEMYLKMSGMDMEALKGQVRPMAQGKVKLDLILDAIAEKEGITISDEELTEKLGEVAKMYGMEYEKLEEELTKAGNLDRFKENVKVDATMQKTVDLVVASAK